MTNKFGSGHHTTSERGYFPDELGNAMTDILDNLRAAFDQRIRPKFEQHDIRAAILQLLAEEPMHGFQIIHEIDTRSGGSWKPSPGTVYPTLQLLVDEGLIGATETDGKKIYTLTEKGAQAAESSEHAPWKVETDCGPARATALPKAGAKLAQAAAQVARGGTSEQVDEAVAAIDEARRKIYTILAQE